MSRLDKLRRAYQSRTDKARFAQSEERHEDALHHFTQALRVNALIARTIERGDGGVDGVMG